MASQKTHTVKKRRRREGKTNYAKRLKLLQSRLPRFVVRVTNTQIIAQIIEYGENGDKVVAGVCGSDIKKLGWAHSRKNVPAGYLAGKALAKKLKEKKYSAKEFVLDTGLHTHRKGSRIYSVLKGFVDGGMNVPCDESVFPSEERLKGEHIQNSKVKEDMGKINI